MIRPATLADIEPVHALLLEWAERVDELPLARETLEAEWRTPGFDVARDHWATERDGRLVGYAALKPSGTVVRRGEGDELLARVGERARERGDDRLEAILTTRDEDGLAAFARAGWVPRRDVLRMWLELAGEPPAAAFPPDVEVRAYGNEDARPLHAFLALAYADNNEETEPFDQWLHFMTAHGDFDPAYWQLAWAGDDLAACCLTWAPFDGLGWVKDLAVHPDQRRRGLGEALLHHAAFAYRRAGVRRVGLKVDSDNPTRAARLYERLGYAVDRVYAVLELPNP